MELLLDFLAEEIADRIVQDITIDVTAVAEMKCYQVLREIREILDDRSFDDTECFDRIEKIVRAFEKAGSNAGSRHDFG